MYRIIRRTLAAISFALMGAAASSPAQAESAVFAGGCFWCMEADFEKLPGVSEVVSGYTGGEEQNPSYKQVAHGKTSHVEAVRIEYDPTQISYEQLLDYFWVNVDPTKDDRQFCDSGRHYRPAIFAVDASQKQAALASRQAIEQAGKVSPIKVTVEPFEKFWTAEGYHQDYYKTNSLRYKYYRYSCGRDDRLEQVWGSQRETVLKRLLPQ